MNSHRHACGHPLAALWVVIYHFRDDVVALFPALAVLDPLVRAGYLGVDLFFVLSGFILCHTYFDQFREGVSLPAYRRFLQARIARVYPVHFVTLHTVLLGLLAAGTLGFEIYSINGSPAAYVAQLFMAHLWIGMGSTFNYPAWSISAEWFAYLLCPPLLIGLGRLRTPAQFGAVAALAFLGSAALLAQRTDLAETWLPRIIGGFVGGAALNMIYRAKPTFRHGPALIWGALALFSVGVIVNGGYWFNFAFGLLIFGLAYQQGAVSRWLSRPSASYWGEVSYALYMTHAIVLSVISKVLPGEVFADRAWWIRVGVVLIYAALIAGAAVVTYHVVERPARERLKPRPVTMQVEPVVT